MGKIRWIRVCVLLVMTVTVMTACGRKNGNNMTTAPDTGSAGAGTTMESRTDGTNQSTNAPSQTAGESGGVLRDMVDDVGDGINNLTDDVTGMSGTTAAGAESSARETNKAVGDHRHRQEKSHCLERSGIPGFAFP